MSTCRGCNQFQPILRQHFRQFPKCWERVQTFLRERWEQRGRNEVGSYRWDCVDCGRSIYCRFPSLRRCVYCEVKRINERQRSRRASQKPTEAVCEQCGGTFRPERRSRRFCSNKCRQKNYREAVTVSELYTRIDNSIVVTQPNVDTVTANETSLRREDSLGVTETLFLRKYKSK